jgi:hypothetical protein
MRTWHSAVSVLIAAMMCLAAPAGAQGQGSEGGQRSGFWFRGGVGPGYASFTSDEADQEVSGSGSVLSFSFGKFLKDDLVVYGDLHGGIIPGPTLKSGGRTVHTDDEDITYTLTGVGVGVGYYVVPSSVFIGGAVGFQRLSAKAESAGMEANTDPGLGVSVVAGKDFIIADKWMLGAGAQVTVGTMSDQDGGPSFTSMAYGVHFTFSFAKDAWR